MSGTVRLVTSPPAVPLGTLLMATLVAHAPTAAQASEPAASAAQTCTVIHIEGLRPAQGRVMLAVYGDAESYQRRPLAAFSQVMASGTGQRFEVCGLNGREVALSLFQDLNANGRLDFNLVGIPSEPWGTSGKAPAMSAPTWASSRIVLDGAPLRIAMSP